MKFIAISLLALFSFRANAQYDQGGIIVPNDQIVDQYPYERAVFIPKKGLIYYEEPEGEFEGKICIGFPANAPGSSGIDLKDSLANASIGGAYLRPHLLHPTTFFETSDNRFHISFDKQEVGFVRILSDSYIGWVSIKELEKQDFQLMYWLDFYGQIGQVIVPPNSMKKPLRISPYHDAEILTWLDEDYFEITVTAFDEEGNTCEGNFCYVKATQFKVHPCHEGTYDDVNIVNEFEGWVRLIDDEGQPLMLHNPWGC